MKDFLLTTNLSDVARKAYAPAASLAAHYHSTIHLVHETELMLAFHWAGSLRRLYLHHHHYDLQQRLQDELRHPAFQEVSVKAHHVSEHEPYEKLVDFLTTENIDLTITAAPEGISHGLLGGFTEELIRYSPIPVLVYRRKSGKLFPRTVLVPLDFADTPTFAKSSLYPTIRFLGDHYRSAFNFLTVLSSLPGEHGDSYFVTASEVLQKTDEAYSNARRCLEVACRELPAGVQTSFNIREGNPVREIVREAKRTNADLILMATDWSTGTVARKVICKSPCSVMTMKIPRKPQLTPVE